MNDLEMAFYREIRDSLQSFEQYLLKSIRNPATDYPQPDRALHDAYVLLNGMDASEREINAIATVARRMAEGVLHSLFVSIDGGSDLSTGGKQLELVNAKTGEPLTTGALYERFYEFLDREE